MEIMEPEWEQEENEGEITPHNFKPLKGRDSVQANCLSSRYIQWRKKLLARMEFLSN